MKILIIHNQYQQAAGEKSAVESQVQLLRTRGHEVILYMRDNNEIKEFSFFEKIRFFFETIYSRKTVREVNKLINDTKPDIAHVHNVFPLISPSVYRVLYKKNIPMIQTVHNFRLMCPNGLFFTHGQICERCKTGNMFHAVLWRCYKESYLLSMLYAIAISFHRFLGTFKKISGFIVLNPFTVRKLIESGIAPEQKIRVIPNFFIPNQFDCDHQRTGLDITYIGRLSEEKGLQDLIECANLLPDLHLIIVGTGPLEKSLQIASLNLAERVKFTGYLTGKPKERILFNALAIVIPSRWYEQFPISALEAMAAAKPLIVPNLGGWPSIVEDEKNGLLYEPGNVADMAKKIRIFLDNPGLADEMGLQGKRLLNERYSSEKYYDQLIGYYKSVLKEN